MKKGNDLSSNSPPPIATHITVVIPVYKAEGCLGELYRRLKDSLETISPDFEIILVEDCGGDQSWQMIVELARQDVRVKGIQLSRNFGQHAATICGFSHARGEWVATLDDDLEHAPEYLPNLYKKALEGHDLVYGVYPERTHKAWRTITSDVARWMFSLAIPSLNHAYTSYRIIRGDIARSLSKFDSPFPFVDGYLSWLTNRYATVEMPHGARVHGASNYTFRKLMAHTINIFVTFSELPLKLASWIGLLSFLVGMIWLGVILVGKLFGLITVSGFASVMAGIILFGGIQLLLLGIFGEYLGRMSFKSSGKPLFLIGHTTDVHKLHEASNDS